MQNITWIRKNILPAIILGCFYAAANFIGSMLEAEGQLSVFSAPEYLSFLLQWILFGAAALLLFALLDNRLFCQCHINVSADVAGNKPKASILRNHYSAVGNEEQGGLPAPAGNQRCSVDGDY